MEEELLVNIIFESKSCAQEDDILVDRIIEWISSNTRNGDITFVRKTLCEDALDMHSTKAAAFVKIDFVPVGTKCCKCGRSLTTGSAYWVEDNGVEKPYGKTCFAKSFPDFYGVAIAPNFTRGAIIEDKPDSVSLSSEAEPEDNFEEEYLYLRFEKLGDFCIPPFKPLERLYMKLKTGSTLSDNDRTFVANIMFKLSASKSPHLSFKNLQACYAYSHCILDAANHLPVDKRDYLLKLYDNLKKNLFLTGKQIEAANKWFSNIKGLPILDPLVFDLLFKGAQYVE